jgi:gas vesicle protein
MNISKALKVKSRLAGEIVRLQNIIKRENSRRSDNISTVIVAREFVKLIETREKLISLKSAIALATAPLSEKLIRLAETKSEMNFYQSLPTREGTEVDIYGSSREKLTYEWTAYNNRQRVDEITEELQDEINTLQDEVDDFNARTQVEFSE